MSVTTLKSKNASTRAEITAEHARGQLWFLTVTSRIAWVAVIVATVVALSVLVYTEWSYGFGTDVPEQAQAVFFKAIPMIAVSVGVMLTGVCWVAITALMRRRVRRDARVRDLDVDTDAHEVTSASVNADVVIGSSYAHDKMSWWAVIPMLLTGVTSLVSIIHMAHALTHPEDADVWRWFSAVTWPVLLISVGALVMIMVMVIGPLVAMEVSLRRATGTGWDQSLLTSGALTVDVVSSDGVVLAETENEATRRWSVLWARTVHPWLITWAKALFLVLVACIAALVGLVVIGGFDLFYATVPWVLGVYAVVTAVLLTMILVGDGIDRQVRSALLADVAPGASVKPRS